MTNYYDDFDFVEDDIDRYSLPSQNIVPIQDVMDDPTRYIIPQNLNAIQFLSYLNILTEQTNDYENDDSWIAIGMLDKENEKQLSKMINNPEYFDLTKPGVLLHHGGHGLRVPIKPGDKDTGEEFLKLFKMFKMQDIQKTGYMTLDEFFANYTNCWKIVKNPYLSMEPKIGEYEDVMEYVDALNEYHRKGYPITPKVKVLDRTKLTKSIPEYIEEAGFLDCYDAEEGKIFLSKKLYEGHMRYKQFYPPMKLIADRSEKTGGYRSI